LYGIALNKATERITIVFHLGENFMNWDIIEGNWKQFKGTIRAKWGKLTDDQLDLIAGKRIELAGKIQEAYGITMDEVEEQIKLFEEQNINFKPVDDK
jgi:uncharacterized protein YjbJ (UPF0337 family)